MVPSSDGIGPVHQEGLCTYADRRQTGKKVVEQLDRLVAERGAPESITIDNGGEFAGRDMENWAYNTNRPHSSLDDRTPAEFARLLGGRPFALPIISKAEPAPCQGFANAGQKSPALDRKPALPNATKMRAKGLPERPMRATSLLERVN
jgi:hypothetical protein